MLLPGKTAWAQDLNTIYRDESHCLVASDIRSNNEMRLSCWCRDALVDARYVNQTYLLGGRDPNMSGIFYSLVGTANRTCGTESLDVLTVSSDPQWKWSGPEVIRTYPSAEVITRIQPERRPGFRTDALWRKIPYTVQLVYRDAQGRITKTDTYSIDDWEPVVK
jgi:hypothetical protein